MEARIKERLSRGCTRSRLLFFGRELLGRLCYPSRPTTCQGAGPDVARVGAEPENLGGELVLALGGRVGLQRLDRGEGARLLLGLPLGSAPTVVGGDTFSAPLAARASDSRRRAGRADAARDLGGDVSEGLRRVLFRVPLAAGAPGRGRRAG